MIWFCSSGHLERSPIRLPPTKTRMALIFNSDWALKYRRVFEVCHPAEREIAATLSGSREQAMGNEHSHAQALGTPHCEQSLYQCSNIGTDNVPAYGFKAPKGAPTAEAAAQRGSCMQYCIPTQNSLAIKGTLHAKIGYCCAQGERAPRWPPARSPAHLTATSPCVRSESPHRLQRLPGQHPRDGARHE